MRPQVIFASTQEISKNILRQIIYQRYAGVVFYRKKAIRDTKKTAFSHAPHFFNKFFLTFACSRMLQHRIGVNNIELLVFKRKGVPGLNFYVPNSGIRF